MLRLTKCMPALLASVLLIATASADTPANTPALDRADAIEQFIKSHVEADGPGLSMIVQQNGETLLRAAYGMANIEHRVAATRETVFRIGSITKQFTVAAVMLLVEQERLSLDDDITKFFPDYPVHGHRITLWNLLNHTSGIKDYTGIPRWFDEPILEDLIPGELIDTFKGYPMDFATGDLMLYNNSAYIILGAIIEEVSGASYADFLQSNINDALPLENTTYETRDIEVKLDGSGLTATMGMPFGAFKLIPTGRRTLAVEDSYFTYELKVGENGNNTLHFFTSASQPAILFEKQ